METETSNRLNLIELYGLAYECPFYKRKGNCPFSKTDHHNYPQAIEWIDQLTLEEEIEIFIYHCACYGSRELELLKSRNHIKII